ncbi:MULTISPECIES: YceK/YidQ family lipoprotein [Cedecea]|nr:MULTISPECIES: YceK/YidQ family lipoprotein [Cedecea]NWC61985.1 YceK/YidQ family lipoprotein [Cedecea sp. P7760]
MIMRNWFSTLVLSSGLFLLTGCSSMMSHSGGKEGVYPGTRASAATLGDDETSWAIKPLVALDLPFTAVLDTVLLPWDMFRKDNSVRSRVEASEKQNLATNSVIPPAELPH